MREKISISIGNTRSTVPYLESGGFEPHAKGAPYLADYLRR